MENINFRKAEKSDIDSIFSLVQKAIAVMNEQNIPQWDELYPTKEDFESDLNDKTLFVGTIQEKIAVVFVLSKAQDEAYFTADWKYRGDEFIVLHRLCVNPDFQNLGVAKSVMNYIEKTGVKSIRLDVFSQNPFALRLYEKKGYHKTGSADWRKGHFYLMEKVL